MVGGTEQRDYRRAHRRRKVHDSAIVADQQIAGLEHCTQFSQRRAAGQVQRCFSRRLRHSVSQGLFITAAHGDYRRAQPLD